MSDLVLHVKREFFDAICSGKKNFEYRRVTEYWRRRIEGREFESVVICMGYPRATDRSRRLTFPWRGYEKRRIVHPHFTGEAYVYAIRLTPLPLDAASASAGSGQAVVAAQVKHDG